MSDSLFYWYKEMRDRMKRLEKDPEVDKLTAEELIKEWSESIETIELVHTGMRARYDRHVATQESFTPAQIDFICYQIGDWYLNWRDRLMNWEQKTHRLGFAKEQLKTMICGE